MATPTKNVKAWRPQITKLEGILIDKVFFNEKNGFFIGRFDTGDHIHKVKGTLPGYRLGLKYIFEGKWESHPRYGKSFAFDNYKVDLPIDLEAVRQYLESFKWLGPVVTSRIMKIYKENALKILKEQPDRVAAEINGLTIDRAKELSSALIDVEEEEVVQIEMTKLFKGLRIPKAVRGAMLAEYGSAAVDMIRKNPYSLIENFSGVGFLTADQLARRLGIKKDDPARISAAMNHVMQDAARGDGHTVLCMADAVKRFVVISSLDKEVIGAHLMKVIEDGRIVEPEPGKIALPALAKAEKYCAEKIKVLLAAKSRDLKYYKGKYSPLLKEDQMKALLKAAESKVFILTGAPGTGKTYTIKAIIEMHETNLENKDSDDDSLTQDKIEIALAAPTGKAARRMTEMTGYFAQTIHKLLDPMMENGRFIFGRDENNPIDADVVIIDETSMLDITLAANLLRAIKPGTRVIFVGDIYQLPPVGPGNFMRDLIASGIVPTEELTKIKRQNPGNIITNCHLIKAGKKPKRDNSKESDFLFVPRRTGEDVRSAILKLVTQALPENYKVDPLQDIQVITPLRSKTILGCNEFNKTLQNAFNPATEKSNPVGNKSIFRIGDKVIQNRNDYKNGVINGDVGFVESITMGKNKITVAFDSSERMVDLPLYDNDLDLAYAITCHKYQGSEAPVVVIPVLPMFGNLILQRSWLYTAISRAQKLCVLVGDWREVNRTVSRMSQIKRQTSLQGLLKKEME